MAIHDQLLTRTVLVDQTKELAIWYGIAFLTYILLTWAYVVVFSHRMTGPVYKMTKLLERATEKQEWPEKLKLRNSDAFPQLSLAFNQFVEVMKQKWGQDK
jgi:methyl-accepting chemotaxis protein